MIKSAPPGSHSGPLRPREIPSFWQCHGFGLLSCTTFVVGCGVAVAILIWAFAAPSWGGLFWVIVGAPAIALAASILGLIFGLIGKARDYHEALSSLGLGLNKAMAAASVVWPLWIIVRRL